jgi:phage terminase Nu1 subunit (DNA packaging protein)
MAKGVNSKVILRRTQNEGQKMMIITGREQIAERMGLSWPTVKKLYQQEGLPLMRLGLKWAMDTEMLAEWLSRKSQCVREVRQ